MLRGVRPPKLPAVETGKTRGGSSRITQAATARYCRSCYRVTVLLCSAFCYSAAAVFSLFSAVSVEWMRNPARVWGIGVVTAKSVTGPTRDDYL